MSVLFRGLAGQKIVVPGAFKSIITGHPALKCTIKANEGALYPLEKNFLFLPKPTLLIPHAEISRCVFSRVGGHGNPRSFDFKISVRGTGAEHLFSNISKEELDNLVEYLRTKQIAFATEEEGRGGANKKKIGDEGNDKVLLDDDEEDDEDESTDEDYDVDNDSEEDEDGSDENDSYDGSDEDDEDEGSEGSENDDDESEEE
mgnify:CR=1 FL=1